MLVNALEMDNAYKRRPLLLQVDSGRECIGSVSKEMEKHSVVFRRGFLGVHRDQAMVERFIRTMAERLFG